MVFELYVYLVDEMHALAIGRNIIKNLHMAGNHAISQYRSTEYKEPLYDVKELRSIAPVDLKQSFDVRSVISRIVDGSEFDEFKKLYGPVRLFFFSRSHFCGFFHSLSAIFTHSFFLIVLFFIKTLVTGFAKIYGQPVGIIGNNGILFNESALKGAHFIELCTQRNIPLIFLQNITGFMV